MNKKHITFALFIFCPLFLANAQGFSFLLETSAGFMSGQTNEYVYHGDRQISRLEWEQRAVPYIHAALNLEYSQFFLRGAVRSAVPVRSGLMRNHDYLLPNSNAMTHFSQHDNFLDRATALTSRRVLSEGNPCSEKL